MDFNFSDEHLMWRKAVRDFCEAEVAPLARHVDETDEFNWGAVRKGAPLGLLGLAVPEAYGGAGVDAISATLAIEELGHACGSTALALAAHNGLACAMLADYGSEELKQAWLPRLTSGQYGLGALALTEPGAGSDLQGGVRTRAVLEGDSWVINGQKMWTTNASLAECIVVLCRTDEKRLTQILVPTTTPGVHIGPAEKKMGLHGSPTHAVTLENVRVPASHAVGAVGKGLAQTLAVLDSGRISIGALSLGLARAAQEAALKYAHERQTFGVPIAQHQAIQFMLADSSVEIETAQWMLYRAAWLKQTGQPFTLAAAQAKLFATEMAERVCYRAIQIHGGYGYSREFPVERLYRDARLMTIGEGSSEIQRLVIARHILAD